MKHSCQRGLRVILNLFGIENLNSKILIMLGVGIVIEICWFLFRERGFRFTLCILSRIRAVLLFLRYNSLFNWYPILCLWGHGCLSESWMICSNRGFCRSNSYFRGSWSFLINWRLDISTYLVLTWRCFDSLGIHIFLEYNHGSLHLTHGLFFVWGNYFRCGNRSLRASELAILIGFVILIRFSEWNSINYWTSDRYLGGWTLGTLASGAQLWHTIWLFEISRENFFSWFKLRLVLERVFDLRGIVEPDQNSLRFFFILISYLRLGFFVIK